MPQELRPFHETIIDVLAKADLSQLVILTGLLQATRIPKNHDAIIKAWQEARTRFSFFSGGKDPVPSLLAQKQEAEEVAKKNESLSLRVKELKKKLSKS